MRTNILTSDVLTVMRQPAGRIAGKLCIALVLAMPLSSCDKRDEHPVAPPSITPRFTASSGSTSTLVGRGTIANPLKVKRKTGDWKVSVDSDPLDIAVQTIVFPPAAHSGWHMHPGPVFILVVQGQMTFYESDDPSCTPIVRTAGQGYLDAGEHAHIARNETLQEARNVVTYFAPVGAALRIDAPAPGNCPF